MSSQRASPGTHKYGGFLAATADFSHSDFAQVERWTLHTKLYHFADLTVASTLHLAELPAVCDGRGRCPDLTLSMSAPQSAGSTRPDLVNHFENEIGSPRCSLPTMGDEFLLRFPNLAEIVIDADGRQIGAWPALSASGETLRHLLLDQVLPRVLGHRGRLVLHAGAVRASDSASAVAFVGETGSGKSTLTASFHAAGFPLLSDDGLVLTPTKGTVNALPTYPSLRLWPESVAGVYSEPPTLAPMAHYSTKQRVVLSEDESTGEPLPLAAIYVLAPVPGTGAPTITLTQLSPGAACMALIENSFQLDVTDTRRVAGLLSEAAKVAQQVPVFRLTYPRDFELLPSVRAAILEQREFWVGPGASRHSG